MQFWLLGKYVLLCSKNVLTFLKQDKIQTQKENYADFFVIYIAGFLISFVIP